MLRRTFIRAASAGTMTLLLGGAALAQQSVKIGLILPMTGPFASTGRQIEAAAKLYMKQNGDMVAGKKVELIVKDDTGAPDVTKRIAQELIVNDKVTVPRRVRPDAARPGDGTACHPGQGAGHRHGGRDVDDHRGFAVHRAVELYPAASHGADGGVGEQERHQEGRHARIRLRAGHRRRKGVQGALHCGGRRGRGGLARAAPEPGLLTLPAEGG